MSEDRFRSTSYDVAFANFLKCTDEKQVLAAEILGRIQTLGAQSLLDIGAGNGDLAIPLSKAVRHYVAIEQKTTYAAKLRTSGLAVIEKAFPLELDQRFDMVLACHSVPSEIFHYRHFLTAAFGYVRESGMLLLVTYDDEESEWNDLLRFCGLRVKEIPAQERRLPQLEVFLFSLGTVQTHVVTTHVRAREFSDIAAALSFVYSASSQGTPERTEEFVGAAPQLEEHLRTHYWRKGFFEFPFHHVVLEVEKSPFR